MEKTANVTSQLKYQSEILKTIRWVFILKEPPKMEQRIQINNFLVWKGLRQNTCGLIKDYEYIMKKILKESDEQAIYLVVDLKSYRDIFYEQKYINKYFISKFNRIYVFSNDQTDKRTIIQQRKKNPLIYDTFDNFSQFIKLTPQQVLQRELKIAQQRTLRQETQNIFVNFNLMSEKLSNKIRTKIISFLKLQQRLFYIYFEKFKQAFENFNKKSKRFSSNVFQAFDKAIKYFIQDNKDQFYKVILNLYKDEECKFYQFLNIQLKKLRENEENWDIIALPTAFLFKAIKFYFEKQSNRQKINKLFDENNQCIFWRVAWFHEKQLHQINSRINYQHIYYELASFTSTSLSKAIACKFLNIQNLKKSCLIKFIIQKPSFEKQIDYLNFMYFAFVIFDQQDFESRSQLNPQIPQRKLRKQKSLRSEQEILFNTLTCCKILKVGTQSFRQIQKMNPKLSEIPQVWKKDIPLLQVKIVQNVLHQFSEQDWSISRNLQNEINEINDEDLINFIRQNSLQKIPPSIKQYLIVVDVIKNHEKFTIGHAMKHLELYESASKYFEQMIAKKEQLEQTMRQIFNHRMELSDIYQKMGNYKKSLENIDISVSLCNQMKSASKVMTEKDYHLLMYKIMEKSTRLLEENDLAHTALEKLDQRLKILKLQAERQPNKRQAKRFFYAELLIQRALVNFRFGYIQQAKDDINQSKNIVDQIMRQINYQQLKKQTFYIRYYITFIVRLLIGEKIQIYNDFQRLKQIENIKQATYIFGGQKKLEKVAQSSKEISLQMDIFIKNHSENLIKEEFQNEILYKQRLIKDTQEHFQQEKKNSSQHLKKQVQQFFKDFKQRMTESSYTKMMKKLNNKMQKLLLFDVSKINLKDLLGYQKDLRILKDAFINLKVKSSRQTPEEDQTYKKAQEKLDRLIQCKRQQNKKFIEMNYKDGYKQYFQDNIKLINMNHQDHSLQNLANKKYQAQLQESLGNYSEAKKTIDSTISSLKNYAANIKMIQLYFSKIRIQFEESDIDFEHCQQKISSQVRIHQKKEIAECNKSLSEVNNLIMAYKNASPLLQQISKEDNQKKNMFIMTKQALISLWTIKIRLFIIHIDKQLGLLNNRCNQSNNKIQSTITNCYSNIMKMKSPYSDKLMTQYYEISSYFLYYLEPNIPSSFQKMKKAIQSASDRNRRTFVLTKLFLAFQKNQLLLKSQKDYLNELKQKYKEQTRNAYYWRICLAYHYNFGYHQQNCQALERCLQILQKRKSYKSALLVEEKKTYQNYSKGKQFTMKVKQIKIQRQIKTKDPYFIYRSNQLNFSLKKVKMASVQKKSQRGKTSFDFHLRISKKHNMHNKTDFS